MFNNFDEREVRIFNKHFVWLTLGTLSYIYHIFCVCSSEVLVILNEEVQ